MKLLTPLCLSLLIAGCATARSAEGPRGPLVDAHQHLVSPEFAKIIGHEPIDAVALLRMLDAAGARQAVVLSMGYSFADERKQLSEPEVRTRLENDWTAAQVAVAPRRLRGFCSVNPLMQGALAEIERCNRLPGMRGLKLHFGNSGVTLRNRDHVTRMREVVALANRLRVPITVHLRSRGGAGYGPEDARLFIDQLLPMAPDITVQIAHLAGAGPGFDAASNSVLGIFVDAIRAGDARTRRLIFDLTTVVAPDATAEDGVLLAERIRAIGFDRIVFGSDPPLGGTPPLREGWALFRSKVPLSVREFALIAHNVPPYLRQPA